MPVLRILFLLLFCFGCALAQTDTTRSEEFRLALKWLEKGKEKKAMSQLLTFPEQHPDYYEANMLLGYLYHRRSDLEKAILYLGRAIKAEPHSAVAYFNRGNCYLEQKKYNLAIMDYAYTIRQDSLFYEAYNNMAVTRVYNQQSGSLTDDELVKARNNILQFAKLSEIKDPRVLCNLGLMYMHLMEFSEAVPCFDKALTLDSLDGKSEYHRALCNYYLRKYSLAAGGFKRSMELNYNADSAREFADFAAYVAEEKKRLGR